MPTQPMQFRERFEDEGFVYELTVKPAIESQIQPPTFSQDNYSCKWAITRKESNLTREVLVTDDECELIVYHSVEDAVKGARDFLSI